MPIDPDIVQLVKLLNKHGVKSFGSCVDVNTMSRHENGFGSDYCSICGNESSGYYIARGFINCIVTDMRKLTTLLDRWKWKQGFQSYAPEIELHRGITRGNKHKWYACLSWTTLATSKEECNRLHFNRIAEMEQEL